MRPTLLIVTGPGRSGTSTMAGILHHTGASVPGPFLAANASNPKGFYESRWSVRFHNRLLRRANVGLADGRPEAAHHVRRAVRPRDREALRAFVLETMGDDDLIVVKDPRATWALELWHEVADDVGVDTAVAVMMRQPAEVVASRATHYSKGLALMGEKGYAIHNCAGWVNGMLTAEQGSRSVRRSFVSYDRLLDDWREELARSLTALDLPLPGDLEPGSGEPHPVDQFVDPTLSRHRRTWDDVTVPPSLSTIADDVWAACTRLRSTPPPAASAVEVDAARTRYETLYAESRALVHDHTIAELKAQERATRRRPAARTASGSAVDPPSLPRRIAARLRHRTRGRR